MGVKILTILFLLTLFGCDWIEEDKSSPPPPQKEIVEPETPVVDPPIIPEDNTPVIIHWIAPSARSNGDVLLLSEIAGYRIYYGAIKGSYPLSIDVMKSTATEVSLVNIPSGIYHLVMTCIDTQGGESGFSTDIKIEI